MLLNGVLDCALWGARCDNNALSVGLDIPGIMQYKEKYDVDSRQVDAASKSRESSL